MADVGARELLAAVFGTDSDSDSDSDSEDEGVCADVNGGGVDGEREDLHEPGFGLRVWQAVECVDGLWRCEGFLDAVEQESLVTAIEGEGWFSQPSHNQAMRFGVLPGWALTLSALISSSISRSVVKGGLGLVEPWPEEILRREPLFDQMIVNSYQPGEGIGPHVDLARFEDGIVVLSLLSSCVMRFRKCDSPTQKAEVLLSPGDLILLSGNARYKWTHEINREQAEEQAWAGKLLAQERRISVTLRRLCPEENAHSA